MKRASNVAMRGEEEEEDFRTESMCKIDFRLNQIGFSMLKYSATKSLTQTKVAMNHLLSASIKDHGTYLSNTKDRMASF